MTKPPTTSTWRLAAARTFAATGVIVLAISILAASAGTASPATAAQRSRSAYAARILNATDTAHLHYVRSSGSLLFEEGAATGTLPGSMRAHVNIGPTTSGSFTIYTHGGTITGHGSATMRGSGRYESFAGTLVVTGGTGRYTHAHGRAGLNGTFDRKTYALLVQTTGRLAY